jgi:hypothetical protein
MKAAAALTFILPLALLAVHDSAWARDAVLPAGTLMQCQLDEPNFSSATASVGDPVLCYPHGLQVFGQTVFPRGTYLVGHLADAQEPGHFWGKGNLHLEFDRIGLPSADVPLSAKIVSVSGGYRVDREGKIIGKGHAVRDTIEWLLPPLWPYKILTLPKRGPRPALKGETRVTLRLMDDVLIPDAAQYRRLGQLDSGTTYGRPALYLRPSRLMPPSSIAGAQHRSISWQPQAAATTQADAQDTAAPAADNAGWHKFGRSRAPAPSAPAINSATAQAPANTVVPVNPVAPVAVTPAVGDIPLTAPPAAEPSVGPANAVISTTPAAAASSGSTADAAGLVKTLTTENRASAASAVPAQKPKLTLFAIQAGTVYAVTDYWRDEDRLAYVLSNGKEGQVDLSELDWKTTTQLNTERNIKVTLREGR